MHITKLGYAMKNRRSSLLWLYSLSAINVFINFVCWKHQSMNLIWIKCGSLFIHGGGELMLEAHRRAWHRDLHVNVERSGYLLQPVSPPMQRVAVSGDDSGRSLPLRLAALCVIHFGIRVYYLPD